ncbi:acyl-CoA dehydrogenase family protein, partial [Kitasatospora sp. NE20-6]
MSDSDLFRPTEEHDMLRDAIRSLAEAKIAPYAAEVDEQGRF